MHSEWMKVMLEEIARKREEAERGREESERRATGHPVPRRKAGPRKASTVSAPPVDESLGIDTDVMV